MIGNKKAGTLFTVIMSLGLAAGCGNSANDPAKPKDSNDQVTLRMVESMTSPKRTELLKGMLAEFEKQNPNIKVELVSPPYDQADNKIRTMLLAKQKLDVIEARDLNVAEYVNNGYLLQLDDYLAGWKDAGTFSSIPKSVGSVSNKLYFIANGLYERQMFYRKDWFDEKGLKAPTTYQEMVDTAKKITDPSKNRYGFSFRGGAGSNGITDNIILAYNAINVNLEDSMFLKNGKTIYSTPEAQQAMEKYKELYKEASPPDSINWGFQEQVQAFTSGVTGILLQDPDVIQSLQEKMKEGTWATAPMPVGPSGKALIAAGGAGWGIASYSTHKDEAWKLIAFLSSPEENTVFTKNYGLVPIHSSAANDEFFKSGPYKTLLDMTNKPDTFLNYKPPFQYAGAGQWGNVSTESQQAFLFDKTTTADLLKTWDAYWVDQKSKIKK
ncbi:multiple sugar transport system substrate-binding protein [Paenibacillus catalpae]|uniref:Multiple sugar transport system substrate-binding protein n=1 Tax=Paenibacillus catalpae TaxID=1045775 RepID=A0A1I2BTJ1_9BACL|nr:sugar ABC transporter substrate-binding protein [Paenibacillus catalpae]SFE59384.1 multiple sugar transport system substrate-binding protein [Paenibacillus catalpae]